MTDIISNYTVSASHFYTVLSVSSRKAKILRAHILANTTLRIVTSRVACAINKTSY